MKATMLTEAFSRTASKPEGSSEDALLKAILRERPDLKGQKVDYPDKQGAYAHTIFIGEEVFKGPREQQFAENFDVEPEILQALAGKGLPIPEVTCIGEESFFYGMKRMHGIVLEDNVEKILTLEQQRRLGHDMVSFVITVANEIPLQLQDERFLAHGDLRFSGNILIDPETNKLSAVIDFGAIEFPAKDNWQPHMTIHGAFRRMLEDEYESRKAEIKVGQPPRLFSGALGALIATKTKAKYKRPVKKIMNL